MTCQLPFQLIHDQKQLFAISLSMNGRDFSQDALHLSIPPRPIVTNFDPFYASSDGGSRITFTGYNLKAAEEINFRLSDSNDLESQQVPITNIFCGFADTWCTNLR